MPLDVAFTQALLADAREVVVRFTLNLTRVRIIQQFRAAGATEPRHAQRYVPRSPNDASAFRELLEDAVLVQTRHGYYFLDGRPGA